jgi:S-adenosylmethionine decarboxylase
LRTFNGADMGHHVLLNLYDCGEVEKLEKLEPFVLFIRDVLSECRAEVVGISSHQFDPYGFTYLALLTTSHFSIHTWPEHRSAAVDIFTCGDVNTDRIVAKLVLYFGSGRNSFRDVLR